MVLVNVFIDAAKKRIIIDNTNFLARRITQKWTSLIDLYLIMLNHTSKTRFISQEKQNLTQKCYLFYPNWLIIRKFYLNLYCLSPYRKLRWAEVGQTYIHIRRNCTLGDARAFTLWNE